MKSIYHLDNSRYAELAGDTEPVLRSLTPIQLLEAEGGRKFMPINNEITDNVNASPRRASAFLQKKISIPSDVYFALAVRAFLKGLTTLSALLGIGASSKDFRIVFVPGSDFMNILALPKTIKEDVALQVNLDMLAPAASGDITVELLKSSDRTVIESKVVTPDASFKGSTTLTVPGSSTETKVIYTESQIVVKKGVNGALEDVIHTFEAELTVTA